MKNVNTSFIARASAIAGMFIGLSVTAASANTFGIVGLFQVENQNQYAHALQIFKTSLSERACNVSRQGMIADEAGDINTEQPNRFLILACDGSVISKEEGRSIFNSLSAASENTVILEGALAAFPEDDSGSKLSERAYILKVSHYNNVSPDIRDNDLDVLRNETLKVADRYRRDMFVDVDRAMGMETPDEVALLYYDTPAQGKIFRENNPEIIEKVGNFNKTHLNDYIYYFGMAEQ